MTDDELLEEVDRRGVGVAIAHVETLHRVHAIDMQRAHLREAHLDKVLRHITAERDAAVAEAAAAKRGLDADPSAEWVRELRADRDRLQHECDAQRQTILLLTAQRDEAESARDAQAEALKLAAADVARLTAERDERKRRYENFRDAYKSERESLADSEHAITRAALAAAEARERVLLALLRRIDDAAVFVPRGAPGGLRADVLAALAAPIDASALREFAVRLAVEVRENISPASTHAEVEAVVDAVLRGEP